MSSRSCSKSRSLSVSRLSQTRSPSNKRRSRSKSPKKVTTPKHKGKRGRPRMRPKTPEGQPPKKRGRPKHGEGPKIAQNPTRLPNSELTRDQLADMINPGHKKPVPKTKDDDKEESLDSDKSYRPPNDKIHIKDKIQNVPAVPVKTEAPLQFEFKSEFETARLIMLTPTDSTQANFTQQPILVLQIRGEELQKLINNSWQFIRNSQLFYNVYHNVPEIKGIIQINSEFTDTSVLKDVFESNEVDREIDDMPMPDDVYDASQDELLDDPDNEIIKLLERDELS